MKRITYSKSMFYILIPVYGIEQLNKRIIQFVLGSLVDHCISMNIYFFFKWKGFECNNTQLSTDSMKFRYSIGRHSASELVIKCTKIYWYIQYINNYLLLGIYILKPFRNCKQKLHEQILRYMCFKLKSVRR